MNKERFSIIGHTGIAFWNPISATVIDDWLQKLPLSPASQILDVGCGRAELILRAVRRFGCRAVGVEKSQAAIEHAQREASRRCKAGLVELRCETFEAIRFMPETFNLVSCVGSIHAVGNLEQALKILSRLVRSGGLLLVAEGYWKQEPPPEYLTFLRTGADSLRTHSGNLILAKELSMKVVRSHEATEAEWSQYEDTYAGNIHRFVESNPHDPDATEMKQRIERWRHAYLTWGKNTLGFGLYLLEK